MTDWIYDSETYPNLYSVGFANTVTGEYRVFEISDRVNQADLLRAFLWSLHYVGDRLVGFNNVGFDYPILHDFLTAGHCSPYVAYEKSMGIIHSQDDDRFKHRVWDRDVVIPQVDLFLIHHFDNKARRTSLKQVEFAMNAPNLQDLPIEPGTVLSFDQIAEIIEYMKNDIIETWRFYLHSIDRIRFREELSSKYHRNFINHNDTKIGKDYFLMRLEEHGIPTKNVRTVRPSINLGDVILPKIQFINPEFNRVLNFFKNKTITETKGVFKDLTAHVGGLEFVFGTGGIHASVHGQHVRANDDGVIIDLDVASYYPNLAIANRFYPEHFTELFCDIYKDVFEQRKSYPKGTPENAMLKLALNGVYGDSNNVYSPFYDPAYTMKITINGQLLLCMLAEWLLAIDGLSIVQVNTDGLTVKVPEPMIHHVNEVASHWEEMSGLTLEEARYSDMFIRDVNNYIAVKTDGTIKRKGAYCYGDDLDWHQNHSSQIIAKAAEATMVHGADSEEFIHSHQDMRDFFILAKVPRSSKLLCDGREVQRISRCYASPDGGELVKVMPPLARKPDQWRHIGMFVGWKMHICNRIEEATKPIDYGYYLSEVRKLLIT